MLDLPCSRCKGRRRIMHPAWRIWKSFYEEDPPKGHPVRSNPKFVRCRKCRGLGRYLTPRGRKILCARPEEVDKFLQRWNPRTTT